MNETILIVLSALSFLCGLVAAGLVVVDSKVKRLQDQAKTLEIQHSLDIEVAKNAINRLETEFHDLAQHSAKELATARSRVEELNNRIAATAFKR